MVTGVTMPGIAGVVIGHSAGVAWGITLGFCDCEDVYLEKLSTERGESAERGGSAEREESPASQGGKGGSYFYKGELVPLQYREELIEIKGGGRERITIRSTHHGPILPMAALLDLEHTATTALASIAQSKSAEDGNGDIEYALSYKATNGEAKLGGMSALYGLNRAQTIHEAREAVMLVRGLEM
jgi:penicillin amidase